MERLWWWGLWVVVSAGRGDIAHEMIMGDLVGSRVVLAYDVRPRKGHPVDHVWPGVRRIGGGRVGEAITLDGERQTDALRGVRRLVVVLKAG